MTPFQLADSAKAPVNENDGGGGGGHGMNSCRGDGGNAQAARGAPHRIATARPADRVVARSAVVLVDQPAGQAVTDAIAWSPEQLMNNPPPPPYLLGRRLECEVLDEILACLRSGGSAVRVVRGEAGIGKTALLDHLCARSVGLTVIRVQGIEADMELPYASLHQLCAPLVAGIEHLPDPQRGSLEVAFGLTGGDPPDRFMVGLAVLHLVTDAAAARPVLVVVDDAQWLDQVSRQTLEFVARRLLAERVALVFGLREQEDGQERRAEGARMLHGLPELHVGGLDSVAAGELLAATVRGPLDARIRDRLVAETHGNPLALRELTLGRTAAELAYGFETAPAGSVPGRVERDFAQRFESLPSPTQMLLLLAAAEPVGDPRLLSRAAGILGVAVDAAPAKAGGLVEFGGQVRFRHPLARSAVYRTAEAENRRAAHRALSLVTDARRRAGPPSLARGPGLRWSGRDGRHRPRSVGRPGPSSGRYGGRGAAARTSSHLDPPTQAVADAGLWRRAEAHFSAAAPDRASELALLADLCPLSALDRAPPDTPTGPRALRAKPERRGSTAAARRRPTLRRGGFAAGP